MIKYTLPLLLLFPCFCVAKQKHSHKKECTKDDRLKKLALGRGVAAVGVTICALDLLKREAPYSGPD